MCFHLRQAKKKKRIETHKYLALKSTSHRSIEEWFSCFILEERGGNWDMFTSAFLV